MAGLIPSGSTLLGLLVLVVLIAVLQLFCTGHSDFFARNTLHASSSPYLWSDVVKAVRPGSPAYFSRSAEMEDKYAKHKATLGQRNETLAGFAEKSVLVKGGPPAETCFSIGSIADAGGKIWSILIQYDAERGKEHWVEHFIGKGVKPPGCPSYPSNDSNAIVITRNTFPYNFQPGISHWLIWGSSKIPESTISGVAEQVCTDFPFAWYENSDSVKSIPSVFHVHLLVNSGKDAVKIQTTEQQ